MISLQAVPGGVRHAAALSPGLPGVDVTLGGAEAAEDTVAGLTEQQLLARVRTALRHHLPSLASHQVPQLVDEEGGGQRDDPASWDGDEFSAHRTPDISQSVLGQSQVKKCWQASKELHKSPNDFIDHL